MVNQIRPDFVLCQGRSISDNDEKVLRSGNCDIEASHVCQKTKTRLSIGHAVGANAVEKDDLLLPPLKGVNRVDFDMAARAALQQAHLALVWRDDSDIVFALTE